MFGSGFNWKQRLFVGLIAPRGIVAAAVASLFAIHLTDVGMESAEELVPIVFLVIVGTIVFCGALARPMARRLGLAAIDPQGVLFVRRPRLGPRDRRDVEETGRGCAHD